MVKQFIIKLRNHTERYVNAANLSSAAIIASTIYGEHEVIGVSERRPEKI